MNSQKSRYVTVARIADPLAQQVLPRDAHPKRPHRSTPPPMGGWPFPSSGATRIMEEELWATEKVGAVLEWKRGPDHTTRWRAFQRLRRMRGPEPMRHQWLDEIGVKEEAIAWDRTGYTSTPARADSWSRTGRRRREFRKGADTVGTHSPFLLAWRQGPGPGYDCVFRSGRRRKARRYGCKGRWRILAD